MAALLEVNQVGKREDFSDVIATVDAKNLPVTSMVPKGSEPANSIFDWQTDAYDELADGRHRGRGDVSQYRLCQ
jgi:hypothetical protein